MAYVEVLTGHSVTVEQWDEQLYEEYTKMLWWYNLMGTSIDMPIQVKNDLTKKPGDAITIQMSGQMTGGLVTGNNVGLGNEGTMSFFGQRIVIDNVRHLIRIDDVPMTQQRTNFDVLQAAKRALATRTKERLDEEITSNLSDVTTGRVRGRYLYGATDSNWNATHATALANIDNAADQLTTGMIDIAKRKAKIPVNATAKIRPMRVKNGKNMEEWFTFVGHTLAIRDMILNDASWKNAQLNIPPQGNSESVIYTGSSFKGSWNGTLIYEYEDLDLVASTIQVAHNFLLGAQAAAVVWGQMSKFGEEEQDLGHRVTYENHEIRGVDKIVYDRSTQEDNGVIHVFSAAVAD
jgi:uncharacterized protein DUF4043